MLVLLVAFGVDVVRKFLGLAKRRHLKVSFVLADRSAYDGYRLNLVRREHNIGDTVC